MTRIQLVFDTSEVKVETEMSYDDVLAEFNIQEFPEIEIIDSNANIKRSTLKINREKLVLARIIDVISGSITVVQ